MKKLFFLILFSVASCISYGVSGIANSQSKVANQKLIRIVGEWSYPPYCYINKNGEADGFNVELIKAIMKEAKLDYKIELISWEKTLKDFKKQKYDIIAGLAYIRERDSMALFSIPIDYVYSDLITREDSRIRSFDDLSNKEIIVQRDDLIESYLLRSNISKKIIYVANASEAIELLSNGHHHAAIFTQRVANNIINSNSKYSTLRRTTSGVPGRKYCIATQTDNEELLNIINYNLLRLKRNGTYDIIYSKWFDKKDNLLYLKAFYVLVVASAVLVVFIVLAGAYIRKRINKATISLRTYQKELEEKKAEIEKANTLLNSIIKHIPIGLFVKDINDNYKYIICNDNLKVLHSGKNTNFNGKTDFDIYDSSIAQLFRYNDIKATNSYIGETITIKYEIELNNKKLIYELAYNVMTASNGHKFLLGLVSDITKKEKYNKDLQLAKEEAVQSDKLKSAFLANMSHEIRTPLNAIVGFSQLIAESPNKADKIRYQNIIATNSDLLLRLISDILDLSKIEAGMIDWKPEKNDNAITFENVYIATKQAIKNEQVVLLKENPYKSCIVNVDKNRLKQIGNNFLTNAIKYTSKGYIKMGYIYINGGIKIYVEDTGIGIPINKRDKVFARFEKLDDFAQGTGLGLSICKAILDSIGGEIGFESTEGVGSTFWAWIPTEAQIVEKDLQEEDNSNSELPDISNKQIINTDKCKEDLNILVAEDNESNFILLKSILCKYKISRAINGQEAVEQVKNNKFNLVLMDIKMPVMDGLEATKIIRTFNKNIRIIAVTANAYDSSINEAINAGCNDVITKPINRQQLYDMLST